MQLCLFPPPHLLTLPTSHPTLFFCHHIFSLFPEARYSIWHLTNLLTPLLAHARTRPTHPCTHPTIPPTPLHSFHSLSCLMTPGVIIPPPHPPVTLSHLPVITFPSSHHPTHPLPQLTEWTSAFGGASGGGQAPLGRRGGQWLEGWAYAFSHQRSRSCRAGRSF